MNATCLAIIRHNRASLSCLVLHKQPESHSADIVDSVIRIRRQRERKIRRTDNASMRAHTARILKRKRDYAFDVAKIDLDSKTRQEQARADRRAARKASLPYACPVPRTNATATLLMLAKVTDRHIAELIALTFLGSAFAILMMLAALNSLNS